MNALACEHKALLRYRTLLGRSVPPRNSNEQTCRAAMDLPQRKITPLSGSIAQILVAGRLRAARGPSAAEWKQAPLCTSLQFGSLRCPAIQPSDQRRASGGPGGSPRLGGTGGRHRRSKCGLRDTCRK